MSSAIPQQFDNVSVICKANVYFDGNVISHTLLLVDDTRKTLGVVCPGSYRFSTQEEETMEIIAGSCRVRKEGETAFQTIDAGQSFRIPANSSFEIEVQDEPAQYVCSYGQSSPE